MARCQRCDHDTHENGFGGKCRHCHSIFCKECWKWLWHCTICGGEL